VFLGALATASAQGITLIEGAASTSLSVVTLDENHLAAAPTVLLQDVEFVPLETTGRTVVQELQTEHSRRIERAGLARVELPGGGRLFEYERLAGAFWGYLFVPADGRAAVAVELPGIGMVHDSPFADRIGVSADGLWAVAPRSGGGFAVLRLDGGVFASTNSRARFVASAGVVATSVMVGRSHVFLLTDDDHVLRCPLADGGTPVDCSPPAISNAVYKDTMAMAGDGSTVAFLYGVRLQQLLWLLGETGTSVALPPVPSNYEEPAYLPEGSGQPALLLNDDATRLFFIDAQLRDESYLLDLTGQLPMLQITEDRIFEPYIGIHILPAFVGTTLIAAIGHLQAMDWFRVVLTPSGGQVSNLTGTGSTVPPFVAGQLDPVQAGIAGGALLATDATGPTTQSLRRIDLVAGGSTVLYSDLTAAPLPGSAGSGPADLVISGQNGDRLFLGSTGTLFAAAPAPIRLSPPNRGPVFGATWVSIGNFGIVGFYLPDGSVFSGLIEQGVTQVCMTAAGGCLVNGPQPRYLSANGFAMLSLQPAAIRRCISGAGG